MTEALNPITGDESFNLDDLLALAKTEVNAGSSSGDVVFLKPGDHWLKFRTPNGQPFPCKFWATYTAQFAEGPTTYTLVSAVVVKSSVDGTADPNAIKYIKLNKTQMNQILKLVGAWKEQLFAVSGSMVQLTITKSGDSSHFSTTIVPDQFNSANATFPETSLEAAAEQSAAASDRMNAKKAAGTPGNGTASPLAFNK